MICKWCGNSLASTETKCKRCGKEVPALSDCGGFYDLVPKARKLADEQPAPVKNPPASRPPVSAPPKKRKESKLLQALAVFTAVGVVVLLVMLFALQGRVNDLSEEIEDLQDELDNVCDCTGVIPGKTDPAQTDPDATGSTGEQPGESDPAQTGPADKRPGKK